MSVVLALLCISAALELSIHLWHPRYKTLRAVFGLLAAFVISVASVIWVQHAWNVFSIIAMAINGYRLFNIGRLVHGRMHDRYLQQVTQRSSYWLIGSQIVICCAWLVWSNFSISMLHIWEVVIVLQFFTALIMAVTTRQHAKHMSLSARLAPMPTKDLPSISVCIPARNETEDLSACIKSLLATDYPKLEILVLDDCSQSTRTPEIIRSFAQKGVRFLQGQPPKLNWLAKNQAYDDLAQAASGEYIVFMGVDIRMQTDTLRKLMLFTLQKNKSMVCVMPLNAQQSALPSLIQPMRYLWELALPRKLVNRPPVLSSCWLIRRSTLLAGGGFAAAARMVVPETHFAKTQLVHNGYSFIASGIQYGVTSYKNISSQRRTAVRVSYPQLHKRPEMVALTAILLLIWSTSLLGICIEALISREFPVLIIGVCVATLVIYLYMYGMVINLAYGRIKFLQLCSFPVAIWTYVGLLHYSMYKYEFSEVIWKGRNVCMPVMHVTPRLPKI